MDMDRRAMKKLIRSWLHRWELPKVPAASHALRQYLNAYAYAEK